MEFPRPSTFRWVFLVADVKQPILGVDFLRHFGLLVDVCRTTQLTVQGITTSNTSQQSSLPPTTPPNEFLDLLSRFPTVTQPSFSDGSVKHEVQHYIQTTDLPVAARMCRLAPERLKIARQEFEHTYLIQI